MPFGGISPVRIFCRIRSHSSRWLINEAGFVKGLRFSPPDASRSLWQASQLLVNREVTVASKDGAAVFGEVAFGSSARTMPTASVTADRDRTWTRMPSHL